jgi:hypothetical protein
MAEKQSLTDEELPKELLARLKKLEPRQEGKGDKRNEFRFERNILIGAGITQVSEVEVLSELAGDKWSEIMDPEKHDS